MDRRKFIRGISAATVAGTETGLSAAARKENAAVAYNVQGFTCVTCAVGLEAMLRGLPGVARVTASYPRKTAEVGFDRDAISEPRIREFIETCGFKVTIQGAKKS